MITDVISEDEFRQMYACWMLDNCISTFIPEYESREEFASKYPLPDVPYVHTQTLPDKEGNLVTLLKSEIILKAWETRNGREDRKFTFYRVLKTFTEIPDVEPYPMGYIVVI